MEAVVGGLFWGVGCFLVPSLSLCFGDFFLIHQLLIYKEKMFFFSNLGLFVLLQGVP